MRILEKSAREKARGNSELSRTEETNFFTPKASSIDGETGSSWRRAHTDLTAKFIF